MKPESARPGSPLRSILELMGIRDELLGVIERQNGKIVHQDALLRKCLERVRLHEDDAPRELASAGRLTDDLGQRLISSANFNRCELTPEDARQILLLCDTYVWAGITTARARSAG